jgi:predicted RNA-binding protein
MSDDDTSLSRAELDDRIAILEGNIRQLVEQAAGSSGSQVEERISDRIAQQREQLDQLILARDGPTKQ